MVYIGLLISIVIAIIIGYIADIFVKGRMPGGIIGSMVAGFVGIWLGSLLFGRFGPLIAGIAIIPAIIGAILFIFVIGLLTRDRRF